jgi:hypothetical protein
MGMVVHLKTRSNLPPAKLTKKKKKEMIVIYNNTPKITAMPQTRVQPSIYGKI